MRFCKSDKGKARKTRKTSCILTALLCAFCLFGCGGITDFLDKGKMESEIDGLTDKAAEKEEKKDVVSKEPVSADASSQEYFQFEENKVEEGAVHFSKSDLEKRREEVGLSEANIVGLQEAQSGNYYFGQLGSEEKILYVECYQIMEKQAEEIPISTTNPEMLSRVYQCIINDHPEFFYLNGYAYTQYTRDGEVRYMTFSGRYLYDVKEVAARKAKIDAVVKEKLGKLMGADEYETVKKVYEDIVLSTDYSLESPDNQNICSVFLDKKSVCNGYAKAAQYLLNYFGIPCIIVNGNANASAHAWNIVQIDGAYYQMDATWGDPSYFTKAGEEENSKVPDIDYSYLCVTTEEISKNHKIDTTFAIPMCGTIKDNYFVREGLYLYGFEEQKIQEIFEAAKTKGQSAVIIKGADAQAYQEIYDNLINQQKIFDYFGTHQANGEYKIAYSGNEELYTISFWE